MGTYRFLTRLEHEYGGRREAGRALRVNTRVLNTLGSLSARNDPGEGRKAKGPVNPLTEPERAWLLALLPRLVLRVAEIEAALNPPPIALEDLPALSS